MTQRVRLDLQRNALGAKLSAEGFELGDADDDEGRFCCVTAAALDAHHRALMATAPGPQLSEAALTRMTEDYRTSEAFYEMGTRAFAEEMAPFYAAAVTSVAQTGAQNRKLTRGK